MIKEDSFSEDFLHFVWQFRLFGTLDLHTVDGRTLQLHSVGLLNTNAGPDFYNAKLIIDETTWAGCVEIHKKSSDWNLHSHQHDAAYNNVVLHVVYEHDASVYRLDGTEVPTLELKPIVQKSLLHNWEMLRQSMNKIPCEKQITSVRDITLAMMLERVLVERLEQKVAEVLSVLDSNKGSWDDTFYQILARNFGFKTNALPFECLAKSLPQSILAKHKNNTFQIEALLFGQSGLLSKIDEDEYALKLKIEYSFLAKKYHLQPLEPSIWKFMRIRPQNFPTIRLAQFASLVSQSSHLFSKVLETEDAKSLLKLFSEITASTYWDTHYRFGVSHSKPHLKTLGVTSLSNLIINTVAPVLFAYGKSVGDETFQQRALRLLDEISPENNVITEIYKGLGMEIKSAFHSQAYIQLYNHYCTQRNCLKCAVGAEIIKKKI